ncbi:(2Fe-2S)-binding protein [Swingsia samuiensis]|uniref:Bacterioferritin-associated ferredoxin n=1 Tax=Swingsia samuiensis TaxID=1293412 RepID=A0A4Y6UGW0_9PROT|nr:(2Fe-2S)-binding protein [Swingsia samuiensis]QDH16809.1 bacterioferritin [Swingsia samuiensis]
MIICSCNALSDKDIKAAIQSGASRPSEIYTARKCRVQCGNCTSGIVCLLKEAIRQNSTNSTLCPIPADSPAQLGVYPQ